MIKSSHLKWNNWRPAISWQYANADTIDKTLGVYGKMEAPENSLAVPFNAATDVIL